MDIQHFIASRSSDNLSLVPLDTGSPVRKRWSRRSLARKSLSPDVGMSSEDQTRETDNAIQDISDELKEKLESLSLRGRTLDPFEAKTLVALLYTSDEGVLERALVTLANLATFEINQNNLREAGCLSRLQNLLVHPKSEVRLATIRALGNMALNEQNQKEMKVKIEYYAKSLYLLSHIASTYSNIHLVEYRCNALVLRGRCVETPRRGGGRRSYHPGKRCNDE